MINRRNAENFCSEDVSKIENYEQAVNDKTQMWHCHHRLEIQGQFRNSKALLKKCGLYYNVPAWQLIFLTRCEHKRLHMLGKPMSEETKKKISLSLSGEKHPMFGKPSWNRGKPMSEETRKKQSISHSGEKSYWFGKHHSDETKKKCAEAFIGTHWWNNGIVSKQKRECPGQGWVRGRLKRKNHK